MRASARDQVLISVRLRTTSGCRRASSWALQLPPARPTIIGGFDAEGSSTPAATSAMASTVRPPSGRAVRPAPGLSNAVTRK